MFRSSNGRNQWSLVFGNLVGGQSKIYLFWVCYQVMHHVTKQCNDGGVKVAELLLVVIRPFCAIFWIICVDSCIYISSKVWNTVLLYYIMVYENTYCTDAYSVYCMFLFLCCRFRVVFKRLSKNQSQSNYFDQSEQERTARWTNQNS